MIKVAGLFTALSILLSIVACRSTTSVSKDIFGGSEILYKYQWNLMELPSRGSIIIAGNQPYMLFFTNKINRVSGSTSCNKFNGSFQLTGKSFISFGPLATTKMACKAGNEESSFLSALSEVKNWSIVNDQLLLSNGKNVLLKLKAITIKASK